MVSKRHIIIEKRRQSFPDKGSANLKFEFIVERKNAIGQNINE